MSGRTEELAQVGRRLREAREMLGLTQGDVASVLTIPRSSMAALEAGRRNLTGIEVRKLACLYRRTPDWIVGAAPDPDPDPELERATATLTDNDREAVLRFAAFLMANTPSGKGT